MNTRPSIGRLFIPGKYILRYQGAIPYNHVMQIVTVYKESRPPLKVEQQSRSEYSIGPEFTNEDSDVINRIIDWCEDQKFTMKLLKRYRKSKKYAGGPGVYHTIIFKNLNHAMLFKIRWF